MAFEFPFISYILAHFSGSVKQESYPLCSSYLGLGSGFCRLYPEHSDKGTRLLEKTFLSLGKVNQLYLPLGRKMRKSLIVQMEMNGDLLLIRKQGLTFHFTQKLQCRMAA